MTEKQAHETANAMTSNIEPRDVRDRCANLAFITLMTGQGKQMAVKNIRTYLDDIQRAKSETPFLPCM
ncbi:MAG: hypothetical protein VW270_16110 [Candidatus Poseidoniales archaeon]